ncbi:MAG: methyltransferase domain-containing protein [Clostridia bacterium]
MGYSALSKYYDFLMTDFDYDSYINFILKQVAGKTGLDLAAGSGEMTIPLSKRGFKMTGGDISSEMLTIATEKARKQFQNILFLVLDLNNLSISKKYDFVTAVCDGFNYVSNIANLKSAFLAVYNALNAGGKFIFDISTKHKLTEIIGNNIFYEDLDKLSYFWTNKLFPNKIEMSLSFFERQQSVDECKQGELYRRYDEQQTQYFYDNNEIIGLLQQIGFITNVYDGKFEKLTATSPRMTVVATK